MLSRLARSGVDLHARLRRTSWRSACALRCAARARVPTARLGSQVFMGSALQSSAFVFLRARVRARARERMQEEKDLGGNALADLLSEAGVDGLPEASRPPNGFGLFRETCHAQGGWRRMYPRVSEPQQVLNFLDALQEEVPTAAPQKPEYADDVCVWLALDSPPPAEIGGKGGRTRAALTDSMQGKGNGKGKRAGARSTFKRPHGGGGDAKKGPENGQRKRVKVDKENFLPVPPGMPKKACPGSQRAAYNYTVLGKDGASINVQLRSKCFFINRLAGGSAASSCVYFSRCVFAGALRFAMELRCELRDLQFCVSTRRSPERLPRGQLGQERRRPSSASLSAPSGPPQIASDARERCLC